MDNKTYTANQVSKFLVFIASKKVIGDEGETEGITNLKLQKILYFVEAYFLATVGRSLFSDEIHAWKYGPVIPDIYQTYKKYGASLIPSELGSDSGIEESDGQMIAQIWEFFDKYSARRLVDMSHSHDPWIKAFESAENGGSGVITRDHMKEYYTGMFV